MLSIAVHVQARRHGLAARLLRKVADDCLSAGVNELKLVSAIAENVDKVFKK